MKRIGHYYCKGSMSGCKDGYYSIDWSDEKMNKFAIWTTCNSGYVWAFAEFKSQKKAYDFLISEFESIRKVDE